MAVIASEIASDTEMKMSASSPHRPARSEGVITSTAQVPKVMKSVVGREICTASKTPRASFFQAGGS